MSTNLIDEMTEVDAKDLLNSICDKIGIGGKARTNATILTNVGNALRRSHCLSSIESHLVMVEVGDDGEEFEESMLNWGESPEKYIETFKEAIDRF